MKIQKRHIVLGVATLGIVGAGAVGTYLELTRSSEDIVRYRPTEAQLKQANEQLDDFKGLGEPKENATKEQVFQYHYGLANSLAATTRYGEAISEFKKAEAVEGVEKSYVFYQALAITYFNSGDNIGAKGAYQTALQKAKQDSSLDPDDREMIIADIKNALEGF